ncbi:MAG: cob(I)yrinic acid a,c-diamide adenosyltransferase [Steroidobacteraceae bacterium]
MTDDINARHNAAMKALKAKREVMMARKRNGAGLLLVNTGEGKGKTTAALGMAARALGWGQRVGIVQFIKGKWVTGERQFFARFPDQVVCKIMGEGFTWETQDRARDIAAARAAWDASLDMIADLSLNLVILDELNIALRYNYLDVKEVVAALANRPADKHICVTGRDAKPELIAIADVVTNMTLVRHPFDQDFKAQRGIDF